MNLKKLSFLSKLFIILLGLGGTLILILASAYTLHATNYDEEIMRTILIWYVIAILCAIPCFIALFLGWRITNYSIHNTIFTNPTIRDMQLLFKLAISDASFLFICNILVFFLGHVHAIIFLIMLVISILGFIFAFIFYFIYMYLKEALYLKEESELTI